MLVRSTPGFAGHHGSARHYSSLRPALALMLMPAVWG